LKKSLKKKTQKQKTRAKKRNNVYYIYKI